MRNALTKYLPGLALAAGLVAGLGEGAAAQAAPGDLRVTLYADPATPYIQRSTGEARAFMCLFPLSPATPSARPECFGFYPRGESVVTVELSDGGVLARGPVGWVETPGNFHFVQVAGPADNVVLRDASRDITWTLSIPRGGSLIRSTGQTSLWRQVTGISFELEAKAFIGADWPESNFQELPKPWPTAGLIFNKVINANRRIDLLSIINNWNTRALTLTPQNEVDFLDAAAATIGAKRPPRRAIQTPADYLAALIRKNP